MRSLNKRRAFLPVVDLHKTWHRPKKRNVNQVIIGRAEYQQMNEFSSHMHHIYLCCLAGHFFTQLNNGTPYWTKLPFGTKLIKCIISLIVFVHEVQSQILTQNESNKKMRVAQSRLTSSNVINNVTTKKSGVRDRLIIFYENHFVVRNDSREYVQCRAGDQMVADL